MGKIDIRQGDSLKLLKDIASGSVDLVIADPPYNLGKEYGEGKDTFTHEEYIQFSQQWLSECKRILKNTGSLYVFAGFRYISYIYELLEQQYEMKFVNWICWHYTQGIGKTRGFSPRHDDILLFAKTDKYKFNIDNIRVPQKYYRSANNMRGANPGDVWEISHIHYCQQNRQQHPTQKPEAIVERMILASTDTDNLVVDPFCGSGTTARVCQQTERNCIGMEINPEYINMINDRLTSPFLGFDSIDERMYRVPNDLNDIATRRQYIANHIEWFLHNHPDKVQPFINEVRKKYNTPQQSSLFDN